MSLVTDSRRCFGTDEIEFAPRGSTERRKARAIEKISESYVILKPSQDVTPSKKEAPQGKSNSPQDSEWLSAPPPGIVLSQVRLLPSKQSLSPTPPK
jgi:hypothetical protein